MDASYDEDPVVPPLPDADDAPPVHNDAELLIRWRQLMGPDGFDKRTLWVLWFDTVGFQAPMIVPVDDIPEMPADGVLDNLVWIAEQVAWPAGDPFSVAMALSRPGTEQVRNSDRAWARVLHNSASRAGVRLWPVHLATIGSVRPLTLDDIGWCERRSA